MATPKGLMLAKRLWNWIPHSIGQREWLLCDSKVKTAACGRRWGKSESTAIDVALYAIENPGTTQIIIAPTDDQTRVIMDEVRRRFYGIPAFDGCFQDRRAPYHEIHFNDAHKSREPTAILTRTAGLTGKGLRGRRAHRVIVDEAAYVPDSVMQEAVTPLLADYDGQLIEVSTPGGRNHFWHTFQRGQDELQPRYRSFRFPTSENPYIPSGYLQAEKESKPERVFQQEYLAQFLEEDGTVFRRVAAAVDKGRTQNEAVRPGVRYRLGVDLARVEDFTVLVVTDVLSGRQVYFERFNQISWERQIASIESACSAYNRAEIVLDSTGIGDPIFEAIRKKGLPVTPFIFTNHSKEALIDNLAMEIEQRLVSLMDIDVQTNELLAYQYEITPSRNVRMNAPSGMHDDCVIALALSRLKCQERGVTQSNSRFSRH